MVNSTLDPKKLYQSYISNPKNRGLGSIFKEEGAGLAPSTSAIKDIEALRLMRKGQISGGMNPLIVNPQIDRQILEALEADERSKTVAPEDVGSALDKFQAAQRRYGIESFLAPPSPEGLGEKKVRQDKRDSEANRIAKLIEENPSIAADSPLDEIANLIKKSETPSPDYATMPMGEAGRTKTQEERTAEAIAKRKQETEEFRAKEAEIAAAQGMPSEKIIETTPKSKKETDGIVKNLFSDSMKEFMELAQQKVPDAVNREEALEKYKKEFSEATGIDISGEVDKSDALMAMGLAMMQNRAGKGFNVGRILNEVGQAGEKAMPYLLQAKKESKEAKLAAGQYALQMIKSDEDARNAIKNSNAAIRKDFLLKNFEAENKAALQVQKALLEGKDVDQLPSKFFDQKIQIGSNTYEMKRGINPSNLQAVFVDPVADSNEIVASYNKTMGGLNSIDEMEKLTRDLIEISEGQVGGLTATRFLDSAEGVLKSMGLTKGNFFQSLNEEETGGRKLSIESEIETIRRAFIMRFKRFISQETGNGISNVDVQNIEAAAGQLDKLFDFKNPEQSLKAFGELRQIFEDSAFALTDAIDLFTDRREYYDGKQGDELYNRTMETMRSGLDIGERMGLVSPVVEKREDGSTFITYDVRAN